MGYQFGNHYVMMPPVMILNKYQFSQSKGTGNVNKCRNWIMVLECVQNHNSAIPTKW